MPRHRHITATVTNIRGGESCHVTDTSLTYEGGPKHNKIEVGWQSEVDILNAAAAAAREAATATAEAAGDEESGDEAGEEARERSATAAQAAAILTTTELQDGDFQASHATSLPHHCHVTATALPRHCHRSLSLPRNVEFRPLRRPR